MADFDNLWDDNMGIDIDTLDVNLNSEKANQIIDNKRNSEIRKAIDWLDDETFDKKSKASQWHELVSNIEKNFNIKRDKINDHYSYKLDKVNGELDNTDDKKEIISLTKQLKTLENEFKIKQQDLLWDAVELNFLKGRAGGLIPDPKTPEAARAYNYFDAHPEIVEKQLATGKYKYSPTEL